MFRLIKILSKTSILISFTVFCDCFSLQATNDDLMCINRITKEPSGSDIQVVENPWKTPRNNSNNVLRVYNINKSGMIWLNLYKYFDPTYLQLLDLTMNDRIYLSSYPQYKGLRFKYFIKGNTLGANVTSKITLFGYSSDQKSVNWTYEKEAGVDWNDWNVASFTFDLNVHCERIQIYTYHGGEFSSTIIPDLEVFIDDIEFYDPSDISDVQTPSEYQSYKLIDRTLHFTDIETGSIISVFDLYGKEVFKNVVNSPECDYTFKRSGIYLVRITGKDGPVQTKILIK